MAHDLGALEEAELELDAALGALDDVAPKAEVARMLRPHARLFSERLQINRGEPLRPDYQEVSAPVLELSFEYPGFVVRSSDPKQRFFCADRSGMSTFARDAQAESRARHVLEGFGAIDLELLEDYGAAPGSRADYLVQIDEAQDARCAFTAYALPQLRALGWKIEIAEDYPYQVLNDEPPWYAVIEEDEQKPDWFSLELGIEIDGHRVNLLPVLLAMVEDGVKLDAKRASRLSPRFVQVPGLSRYVPVPAERLQILMQVMAELYHGLECDGETIVFPEVRAAALGRLEQAFAGDPERLRLTSHESIRERAKAFSAPPREMARVHATSLQASLRPYQEAGLAWLQHLREHGVGGVLADDMGLGKTLQTIAHLCVEKQHGRTDLPSLVVAPTSLVSNWQRELAKFAPHLRVTVLHGKDRDKRRADVNGCDVCLTTYPVLVRDEEYFGTLELHYVILDEAQTIKNRRSRAHEAVQTLKSRHRLCLTGTPIENSLEELWSLFDFLMPGLLGDELNFRHFYRFPIEIHRDEERLAALRNQVSPYILRRMKRDVAKELPPKTEIVRPVELRGKQRELYESIRVAAHADVRSAIRKKGVAGSTLAILDALMKLRQLCCDPRLVKSDAARFVRESGKYELCFELLTQLLRDGHRVLLFSQFTSMLALLAQGLQERKLRYATLTGATQNRQKPVDEFECGKADVFLISLKAGGTGLNLVSADTVIHYDPWWNPAAQDQATDRAYRIGQKKPVFVYNLVAAGSVEERMLGLQQRKRELAGSVLGAPAGSGLHLGLDEVEQLFSPLVDASDE
jgi:superfamily II DNA or RNA helicase